ncbi:MAG: hypothetical protein AAFN94_13420 [Pseudomonadota bacterium]
MTLLIALLPLLPLPVALIWGLRAALIVAVLCAASVFVAPYGYFGLWALIVGQEVVRVLASLVDVRAVFLPIAAWVLLWGAGAAAVGAGVRAGWRTWRGAQRREG